MKLEIFRKPLKYIKDQQLQFVVWIMVVVLFGLAGIWMPALFTYLQNGDASRVVINHFVAGSFASFCVVILADGLATTMTAIRSGINITSAGMRGFVGIFSVLLIVVNVGILSSSDVSKTSMTSAYIVFQASILMLSVVAAIYLYCFRSSDWEKDVDEIVNEENERIKRIKTGAISDTSDSSGVKL